MKMTTLSFTSLIQSYKHMQSGLASQIKNLASKGNCQTNPAAFILLQFQMAQVTQVGESITNMIKQVCTVISAAIQNQKTQ